MSRILVPSSEKKSASGELLDALLFEWLTEPPKAGGKPARLQFLGDYECFARAMA